MQSKIIKEIFNPLALCLPVLAVKYYQDKSAKARFLGSAVMLDNTCRKVLTCAHLLDEKKEDEILCIASFQHSTFYPLKEIKRHPSIDLLIAEIDSEETINSLLNVIDEIKADRFYDLSMGTPVRAFGYSLESSNGIVPEVSIEMRQGIVTLSSPSREKVFLLGGNSRIELSFAVPCGFSGGPLLLVNNGPDQGFVFLGILYNHMESRIAKWEHEEVIEGNMHFRETRNRIEEHALVHSLADIRKVIIDLEGKV